jgi:hypothetical protein
MQTLDLEPHSWEDYFTVLGSGRFLATVQRLNGGSHADGEMLTCQPLRAIAYDPGKDVIELAVGGKAAHPALRYFVSEPRKITVTESNGARAILVDDAGGVQTFIGLFDLADSTQREGPRG